MKYIIAALIFITCGCMTTETATNYLLKNGELSTICAGQYPVKEFTTVKIETKYDTLQLPGATVTIRDTIPCPDGTKVPVTYNRPCPPAQVIIKTVTKDSTVLVESTAKVDACQKEIVKRDATIQAQQNEIDRLNRIKWWFGGGGFLLACGIGVFLKLYFKL